MAWDPDQYEKFKRERARPFFDLLAQLEGITPKSIVDLGCGTGELTAELVRRWPDAEVLGIDSSAEMIGRANAYVSGKLGFHQCAIEQWTPAAPFDLVFSNSAFHWLRPHEEQVLRLAGHVASAGTLAFQAPNQFGAASHTIIEELRNEPQWRALAGGADPDAGLASPEWYLAALTGAGFAVRVFETTYYQVLRGEDAVLEWLKGTALRAPLARLDPAQQERFLEACGARLRAAYPQATDGGTLFPYRRLFVIARRER